MPQTGAEPLNPIAARFNATLTEANTYTDSLINNRPHARRRQNSAQTCGHTSLEKITNFGSVLDTQVDIVYANGDWTIGTSGVYQVLGQVAFVANGTGYRRALIYNGGTLIAESVGAAISSLQLCVQVGLPPIYLAAGTIISLRTVQTSGGNLNTVSTDTFFGVSWLHP